MKLIAQVAARHRANNTGSGNAIVPGLGICDKDVGYRKAAALPATACLKTAVSPMKVRAISE
jgi:hypothetical protein